MSCSKRARRGGGATGAGCTSRVKSVGLRSQWVPAHACLVSVQELSGPTVPINCVFFFGFVRARTVHRVHCMRVLLVSASGQTPAAVPAFPSQSTANHKPSKTGEGSTTLTALTACACAGAAGGPVRAPPAAGSARSREVWQYKGDFGVYIDIDMDIEIGIDIEI